MNNFNNPNNWSSNNFVNQVPNNNWGTNYGVTNNQMFQNNQGYNTNMNQQQVSQIYSRYVTKEEDILPNEVPMDGSIGAFIQKDLNKIFLKTWGRNGSIYTETFIPVNQQNTSEKDPVTLIMERLDNIENSIADLSKNQQPYNKRKNYDQNRNNQSAPVKEEKNNE